MKDNEFNFVARWSQEYPELQDLIDREMNKLLEQSQYKEANEIINRIKGKLNE